MSEKVRNSQNSKPDTWAINQLIEALRPSYEIGEKTELLTDLAGRLSRMVDKVPSWGWRYIHGVANGSLIASPRLIRAVQLLIEEQSAASGIQIPGRPAKSVLVNALARVRMGALILSPSRPCDYPACTIHFVPRVPWQRYCPRHQSKKSRRKYAYKS